jgi:PTS system nitrogen regulatory IIA component
VDLGVRETADLLGVSEETVHRWIRTGGLPAQRVRHQYRINRIELHEWALAHGQRTPPELLSTNGDRTRAPSLAAALARGGVHRDVSGGQRDEVLASLLGLATIPTGMDRKLVLQLLRARDAFVVSKTGGGVALPHPRDPIVVKGNAPHAVLGFLTHSVPFGSREVRAVVLLFAPSVSVYLGLLGTLAYVLHDDLLGEMLSWLQPREAIIDRIRALEGEPAAS